MVVCRLIKRAIFARKMKSKFQMVRSTNDDNLCVCLYTRAIAPQPCVLRLQTIIKKLISISDDRKRLATLLYYDVDNTPKCGACVCFFGEFRQFFGIPSDTIFVYAQFRQAFNSNDKRRREI